MKAQLDATNCIGINLFAQLHGCNDLAIHAREYIEKHFTEVSLSEEFLQIGFTQVSEIMTSNELNVEKEEIVFDALLRWIHYDMENRREHMCSLIQPIRFGLLSLAYLQKSVMKCPLISSCAKCSHLVTDIKSFEMNPATYRGQYKFNMVLRLGMIKPEKCFLLLSSNKSNPTATVNCYNPLTRETYYVSMIQPDQCMLSHDQGMLPDDPFDYEGAVYDIEYPACVVTAENQIYLAGGNTSSSEQFSDTYSDDSYHSYNEHSVQKHFFLYDNDHDTWVRKAPMLFPKSNFALVHVSGKIYCFGGVTFYQHPTEIIECYDCVTNRWTYVGMMPVTLVDLCAISYEKDIYILGGRTGVGAHNVLMKYNITDATWSTLAHMPTARFKFGVCIIGNEIYVVGGQIFSHSNQTITRNNLCSVEVYNIALNKWHQGPDLPHSMYNVGMVLLQGYLYACGTALNESRGYQVYSHIIVYRMDLLKRKWELVESDLCGAHAYVCITADMYTRKLSQVFRPDVDT